jgi:hypothetical protein
VVLASIAEKRNRFAGRPQAYLDEMLRITVWEAIFGTAGPSMELTIAQLLDAGARWTMSPKLWSSEALKASEDATCRPVAPTTLYKEETRRTVVPGGGF